MNQRRTPKVVYSNRRSGCNPRTGEPLQPWQEVQVTDPNFGPWETAVMGVTVATEDGSRELALRVRFPKGGEMGSNVAAAQLALSLGFKPGTSDGSFAPRHLS
jgi:hypothetical protein